MILPIKIAKQASAVRNRFSYEPIKIPRQHFEFCFISCYFTNFNLWNNGLFKYDLFI